MVQLLTMFEIIYLYPLYALLSYQQLICNKQILIYLEKSFSVNDDLAVLHRLSEMFSCLDLNAVFYYT